MNLSILYRGDLSGCNYDCPYCPFAKRKDSREVLAEDARQVQRFVAFVTAQPAIRFKLFFTPWGEGLIRKHYQQAMVALSRLPQVERVAIQTNLSCRLEWLQQADKEKIALWTTYHPGQVSRERFLDQCRQLDAMGITYSVGVVGFKETIAEIEALRTLLPSQTYLWVNALKKTADYYTTEEKDRLMAVDPFVPYNMVHHASAGKACRTGHTVISVNGAGDMFRCHFVKEKLGNLYEGDFRTALFPRPCTNTTCGCHIGYVHLEELGLYDVFRGRELERIAPR
ncbi:STM4011 family radical SAM protein [Paraflavitalea pollutisoli]|uniref:STM4011 family radical SAM protein n=1 Tax=Paraflavitalea pollutisoli TaxID=3034143 RepID=UPI0023EB4A62|nr:STM4011 family radical SAM protein [Paraflavitalea sp. H1-2-19X]